VIDQAAVEREVLSLATEDWTHAWELVSVCSRMFPNDDQPSVRNAVRLAIERLVERGLVQLSSVWYPNEKEIARPSEVGKLLDRPSVWEYQGDMIALIGATSAGMDEYFGRREGSSGSKNSI
jgi:hypothetical protein